MAKKKRRKKKSLRKKILKSLIVITLLTISLALIAYPYISNYIYEHQIGGIVDTLEKQEEEENEEYKEEIARAVSYNEVLAQGNIKLTDPFKEEYLPEGTEEYHSLLNMTDDGVMGFIKIPCIDVSLPIYHGTSGAVLEKGVGHLEGTSLPVGGDSTHCVLTGHSGMSRAKLFSDLGNMEKGDMFFLSVMGQKLAYVVDQISVVLPSEVSSLSITDGADCCTLITCTPYGVNTHRLLVRGIRTEYVEETENPNVYKKKDTQSNWMKEYLRSIVISFVLLIVMIILLVLWRHFREEMEKKKRRKQKAHRKKKRP